MQAALLDAIQQRYACREFGAGESVSSNELAVLLKAGSLAPSAFVLEPWRFISVTDTAKRASLARACFDQPEAQAAAAFIVIVIVALVDALKPESDYVRARFEAKARGGDVAPIYTAYRTLFHADSIAAWAQGQCNFAAAHLLLQAAHMGLGGCPIGGFEADTRAATPNISLGETPALVIALGHCNYSAPERLRKPLD